MTLLRIVDKAAPPSLFAKVHRRLKLLGNSVSYWKTFWYPFGEPANVVEELALALRPHLGAEGASIVGTEWWIGRMHTTNVLLDFHHDRDLKHYERTGEVRHPKWSSVFFFNQVRGGSLFITNQRLVRHGDDYTLTPEEPTDFATARPAANRFAIFPGDLLHGVLDANDEVPHGRLPGPPGRGRLSLVYNWWEAPPEGVPQWSERRIYRALGDRRLSAPSRSPSPRRSSARSR